MTEYGKYDPENPEHSSLLFSYGEVPVASAKLNRWNGNIAASLDFLAEAAVTLFGGLADDFILPGLASEPLLVRAQETPDMTVRVSAGRCIVSRYFAGIDAETTLPETDSITAPATNDRIDIVVIERSGNARIMGGTEGDPPAAPDATAGTLKLAELYLRPGATVIKDTDDGTNGFITDARPSLLSGRAHRHAGDREPQESPDGTRTAFSTDGVFLAGTLRVYLNGVLQRPGASGDYTEDSDRAGYTFTSAPKTGDIIQHFYEEE